MCVTSQQRPRLLKSSATPTSSCSCNVYLLNYKLMEVYAISCTWLRSKPEIKLFLETSTMQFVMTTICATLIYPIYDAHAFDVCLTKLTSA